MIFSTGLDAVSADPCDSRFIAEPLIPNEVARIVGGASEVRWLSPRAGAGARPTEVPGVSLYVVGAPESWDR